MPNRKSKHRPANLKVAVVIYDGLCAFEFGICIEVFGLPRPEFDSWYELFICGAEPGPLRTLGGMRIEAPHGVEALADAGTILLPGWRGSLEKPPEALLQALRRAHARGARLLSICSGVFVLAAAGLLSGHRATTHWRYTSALADAYPDIHVEPNVLYIDEGNILTSAGSAAGLDLCLHIVRRDWGPEIANIVARRLVVPPHREGGQAQYIERPLRAPDDPLAALFDWARERLDEGLEVKTLAAHAGMSVRTLSRRFHAATGLAPGEWLITEKLAYARELLESTSLPIEQVATSSGFGSADTLRHHFHVRIGVSPTQYRTTFRLSASPEN